MAFFSAGFGAQKLLVVPKATPADVGATYAEAIRSMQQDPEYLALKAAVIGSYEQGTGESADRLLYRMATDIPEEPKRWIRSWLRREYKVNI